MLTSQGELRPPYAEGCHSQFEIPDIGAGFVDSSSCKAEDLVDRIPVIGRCSDFVVYFPYAPGWGTQGNPNFSLPTETRNYVPQVLAAMLLFLHPEEYNLEFPEFEADSSTIVLDEEISIGELTTCFGQQGNSYPMAHGVFR